MNIFWLSMWPSEAARMHCDKHVRKQYLETVQMLCLAFPEDIAPYRRTKAQYNHPCSKWVRANYSNFHSTLSLALSLKSEYHFRFNKSHGCDPVLYWIQLNKDMLTPFLTATEQEGLRTMPPIVTSDYSPPNRWALSHAEKNWVAMEAEARWDPVVMAYRHYYLDRKSHMLTYTKRMPPNWVLNFKLREEEHHGRVERIES